LKSLLKPGQVYGETWGLGLHTVAFDFALASGKLQNPLRS